MVEIRLNHDTQLFRIIRDGRTVARVDSLEEYQGSIQGTFIAGYVEGRGRPIVTLWRREVK